MHSTFGPSDARRELLCAINELLSARYWATRLEIIEERYPELLSDEADALLVELILEQERDPNRLALEECLSLLRRCRKVGILQVAKTFNDLNSALDSRKRLLNESSPKAFDVAIHQWENLLSRIDLQIDPELYGSCLSDTANLYLLHYRASHRKEDLDRAITLWKDAARHTPKGSINLIGRLSNLAVGLKERFSLTKDVADLKWVIKVYRRLVGRLDDNSPDFPSTLNDLGTALSYQYDLSKDIHYLEKAIDVYKKAEKTASKETLDIVTILINLGSAYKEKYKRKSEIANLDAFIETYQRLQNYMGENDTDLPAILIDLGNGLKERYNLANDLSDLENFIKIYRQLSELLPESSQYLPIVLSDFGVGLCEMHKRMGNPENIEEAIEAYSRAIKLYPRGPFLPTILNNLGLALRYRYDQNNELSDLNEIIKVTRRAIRLTPKESPELPIWLGNLVNALGYRGIRLSDFSDLEEAVKMCRRAIRLIPKDSPRLPCLHIGMGIVLSYKYFLTGDFSYLERSSKALRIAVMLTPVSSPDLTSRLINLGGALMFTKPEEAIKIFSRALNVVAKGSPFEVGLLDNLGLSQKYSYSITGNISDLKAAFIAYEKANRAVNHMFFDASVSYKLGIRQKWKRINENIVEIALLLKNQASKNQIASWNRLALVAAEGSKSRLLNELLCRGDIPAPDDIPIEMAKQEADLTRELVQIDTVELARIGKATKIKEATNTRFELIKRRGILIKKLEQLWEKIENKDDYGPYAVEFVLLRRGYRSSWKSIQLLAKETGPETAFVSLSC